MPTWSVRSRERGDVGMWAPSYGEADSSACGCVDQGGEPRLVMSVVYVWGDKAGANPSVDAPRGGAAAGLVAPRKG